MPPNRVSDRATEVAEDPGFEGPGAGFPVARSGALSGDADREQTADSGAACQRDRALSCSGDALLGIDVSFDLASHVGDYGTAFVSQLLDQSHTFGEGRRSRYPVCKAPSGR